MTDLLEGLGAELRKAAKTTEQVIAELRRFDNHAYMNRFNDYNHNAERSKKEFEDFKKQEWLPTGLAAKEMRRIEEDILKYIEANLSSTIDFSVKQCLKRKVKEVFG